MQGELGLSFQFFFAFYFPVIVLVLGGDRKMDGVLTNYW